MYSWRITKYNPKFRNENGSYKKDDWTSFADISKKFNDITLTLNDYMYVESLYVNTIVLFMNILKIPFLKIIDLEKNNLNWDIINKYKDIYPDSMIYIFNNIKNNSKCDKIEIEAVCRLVLREHIWLKFEYKNEFFIHFGYDYYMYIGSNIKNDLLVKKTIDSGLFIEEFVSPYME